MSRAGADCLVNGHAARGVDAADRGFRYGDGVFETIALVDHEPRLLDAHLSRLATGCERLGFRAPPQASWHADLAALARPRYGVLRLSVSRGPGGRGYAAPRAPACTRVSEILAMPEQPAAWWQAGVRVRWCATRLAIQPALAGIKHMNRLEQVLARSEWQDPQIAEGLMRATDGRVVEATAANLVVDAGDRLLLPVTRDCGVDGIMQAWLGDRAQAAGIPVERAVLQPEALMASSGVMLCNSLIGVWPVRVIDTEVLALSPQVKRLQAWVDAERLALSPAVTG